MPTALSRDAVEAVEGADIALTEAAAGLRDTPPVELIRQVAAVADQPPMLALAAGGVVVGLALGERRVAGTAARMFAAVLLATLSKAAIKRAVDRTRPHLLVDRGHYRFEGGSGDDDGDINSFPSGHTADAVAAAAIVARDWPRGATPAWSLAVLVGAVQIPACRHYASDVLAGALIGAASARAIDALMPAREPVGAACRPSLNRSS